MANIKINEKVLKELFDRFPNIKTAALAARTECAQTVKASDELFKSAIRTSFRLTYLDDTICKCGQSGFFSYIAEKYAGISRATAFRYLQAARHMEKICECLQGLSCEEINEKIGDEKFVEEIFTQAREKAPKLSLTDLYRKELPAPEKKESEVPAISDEAWEIINKQEKFQNQTGLFGLWFSEADNINFLYDEMPLDLLRQAKEVADAASANIARILEERENSNG